MTTSQRGSYRYYRALEEDQVSFVVTNCNRPTPLPQVMNKDQSQGYFKRLVIQFDNKKGNTKNRETKSRS